MYSFIHSFVYLFIYLFIYLLFTFHDGENYLRQLRKKNERAKEILALFVKADNFFIVVVVVLVVSVSTINSRVSNLRRNQGSYQRARHHCPAKGYNI